MTRLILGTRGSALALTQANHVAGLLRAAHPDVTVEITVIKTHGDATQAANVPLSSFGEKGVFAREIETALLAGEIDFAVHSMKDLPHTLPAGLCIAAVPQREDPRDVLIGSALDALPHGATVGTGSVRRRALLAERRPDLQFLEIRGNIDTRLRKLEEGPYDAICLACAGLNRLGLSARITEILDSSWFTPDPCQGALAIEAREDDASTRALLSALTDHDAEAAIRAERAFLRSVGGSCQTPVGALATLEGEALSLLTMVADPKTGAIHRGTLAGPATQPEELGERAARELLS
jgi:hydroxymethylbilane synthase